ncbi:MAG: ATP-binding protein [Pseudomonadota bacterium]
MIIATRLYSKLAIAMLVLFGGLGTALIFISYDTSERYSLEVTQQINRDIALHAAEDMPLFRGGEVNETALKELAHHVMFINPIVEVYLLDTDGHVLSHALPYATVLRDQVDMAPLRAFLGETQQLPIFGDDPRSNSGTKVFSVSPIEEAGETQAYLYTVLNGKRYDSLRQMMRESYNLRTGIATIAGSLTVAVIAGLLIFALLTRRLQNLMTAVRAYREGSYKGNMALTPRVPAKDEIDELGQAIVEMSNRIDAQFSVQQELDKTRRELIANVSHDLRTPIAAMQGYLETVLIKQDDLSPEQQRDYLETAFKHIQRLNALIGDLFELSKLESGGVEPNLESFSLMELVQDLVQDYELQARDRGITLSAHCAQSSLMVNADIALIHRVLENLLQNALRHTAAGGHISIEVLDDGTQARVEVADDGEGIASHEIPYIFDRFYRPAGESGGSSHGLGLAIVKRIIDLHRSRVEVRSDHKVGTVFTFWLPVPT